jgi:hypothetical protein
LGILSVTRAINTWMHLGGCLESINKHPLRRMFGKYKATFDQPP